jgi:peptidyl-prolyl cis-trans isomerase A (cyclophilin A)
MLKKIALAAGALLFAANLMAATPASAKAPHVLLDTSFGKIEIELDPVKARSAARIFWSTSTAAFTPTPFSTA